MSKTKQTTAVDNTTQEHQKFRIILGSTLDTIPMLLTGKDETGKVIDVPREPATPKKLLYEQLYCTSSRDLEALRAHSFYATAIAVMDNPDLSGEIKLIHYSQKEMKACINSLNPTDRIKLIAGSLPITKDFYHSIPQADACILSPDVVNHLREDAFSEKYARRKTWIYMAEGITSIIDERIKSIQDKDKDKDFSNSMGIWFTRTTRGLQLPIIWSNPTATTFFGDLDNTAVYIAGVLNQETPYKS